MIDKNDVAERASAPPTSSEHICRVPGCDRLTQRSAGKGLSYRYCNTCLQRFARTGVHAGRPLSAYLVVPYRRAASRWIKDHASDRYVRSMLEGTALCLKTGNPEYMALWGTHLAPAHKAEAIRGWLHMAGVTAHEVLAVVLAVLALCRQRGVISTEYIHVNAARAVMRKHGPQARSPRVHASGRVLRHLGKQFVLFPNMFADAECLEEIAKAAQPMVVTAELAELRRKEHLADRARKRANLTRMILRATQAGAGPHELEQLRSDIMQRYWLSK